MSTNATIAITDGVMCKAVYLHWRGDIAGAGFMLHNYYSTPEKAEELIALGSLSSLRERAAPYPGEKHTFEKPVKDVTVAYSRDRGEPLQIFNLPDMSSSGDKAFIEKLTEISGGNYAYLFDSRKGEWLVGGAVNFLKEEKRVFPKAKANMFFPLEKWF